MTTEQASSGQTSEERHSGGNPSQAPESGALGTEQPGSSGSSGSAQASAPSEQVGSRSQGAVGERERGAMGRARSASGSEPGPFSLMRRFSEDVDRMFSGLFGSGLLGQDLLGSLGRSMRWPEIEVHQEGNRWVVQADVPGLRREDVKVEVRDEKLVISGERLRQNESREDSYYRSERSYGSFSRAIALPEGANLESASASFEHGVLRVEVEVPEQQPRSRRIEIREGSPQ